MTTFVVSEWEYTATRPDELSFEAAVVIKILETGDDGWSKGENMTNNEVGHFPNNFTRPATDEEIESVNSKSLSVSIAYHFIHRLPHNSYSDLKSIL